LLYYPARASTKARLLNYRPFSQLSQESSSDLVVETPRKDANRNRKTTIIEEEEHCDITHALGNFRSATA